jgi:hypothetical protein
MLGVVQNGVCGRNKVSGRLYFFAGVQIAIETRKIAA